MSKTDVSFHVTIPKLTQICWMAPQSANNVQECNTKKKSVRNKSNVSTFTVLP